MYLTTDLIIKLAALVSALSVIGGTAWGVFRWLHSLRRNDEDIRELKEEQCLITYAMLAALDGLKQLNCNGPVTEARDKLEKHINKRAHGQM